MSLIVKLMEIQKEIKETETLFFRVSNWEIIDISSLIKHVYWDIWWVFLPCLIITQKHPSRGVPKKRCSENMQQIYRRTSSQSVISIKNTFSEHLFLRTPLEGCFWILLTHFWQCSHFTPPENTRNPSIFLCF